VQDDLEFLKSAVAGFRGYSDDEGKRGSDQRVRSLLGEALTTLRLRLNGKWDPALSERFDAVLFRCQFADQRHVAAVDRRKMHAADVTVLARADRALVESALGLAALDAAGLTGRLEEITLLLDRRSAPFG
jgi:hypothetical protein